MKRFSEFLQLYFIKGNLTLDRSVLLFLPYLSRYAADRALRQIIFIDKKLEVISVKIPAYLFVTCRSDNRISFCNVN